jgi:hypothetical protein
MEGKNGISITIFTDFTEVRYEDGKWDWIPLEHSWKIWQVR